MLLFLLWFVVDVCCWLWMAMIDTELGSGIYHVSEAKYLSKKRVFRGGLGLACFLYQRSGYHRQMTDANDKLTLIRAA